MNKCNKCDCFHSVDTVCKVVDASCVKYHSDNISPSLLMCFIEASNGETLQSILEKLDAKLCDYLSLEVTECFADIADIEDPENITLSQFLISLQNYICSHIDEKVKTSENDPTPGYLFDKISTEDCIVKQILIDPDNSNIRTVHLSLDYDCIYEKLQSKIVLPNCYDVDCTSCHDDPDCTPKPLTPVITKTVSDTFVVTLSAINTNGVVTWYNGNDEVVGYGSSIVVETGEQYYAKSQTVCGYSNASNIIDVSDFTVFTYTKTTLFTKNNCPTNGCGMPCVGTQVSFSKTYSSYISQSHAISLANSDVNYPIEGQNYANANGTCNCPSCGCVYPISTNQTVVSATCQGNTVQSNGSVSITGISNANRFGYSFNTPTYQGQNYASAYNLGYTSGAISSSPSTITISGLDVQQSVMFRLFNNEAGCYTDILVNLNPPSCSGSSSIGLGNVNVSCDI